MYKIDELKIQQKVAWQRFQTCRTENGDHVDKRIAWEEHKRITTEIYNLLHPDNKI